VTGSDPAAAFSRFLGDLLGRTLTSDPATRERLERLDGRRLRLVLELPGGARSIPFDMAIDDGALRLAGAGEARPQVIARGPAPAFLAALGLPGSGTLDIDGDQALLGEVLDVLSGYRPPLPPEFEALVDGPLASQLLGLAEAGLAALRSAAEGARHATRAQISRRFVDQSALTALLDPLDDLKLRTDRLAARVSALEAGRNGRPGQGP